jgi:hypothetical protein
MRYLNENEQAMAADEPLGELHEGPDGRLYEWVDGVDAWGGAIGFWQGAEEHPVPPRVDGLGALYEAPDGSLYQVHGLAEDADEDQSAGDDAAASDDDGDDDAAKGRLPKMGPGRPGEIRTGPDGRRYRWVRGLGAGGKAVGFWRRVRPRGARPAGPSRSAAPSRPAARPAPSGAHGRRGKTRKPFLKRLLPLAKVAASLIPVPGAGQLVRAGLTVADKALTRRRAVAGLGEIGALYAAPDGSLYQVQGADDLDGFHEPPIDGFADDDGIGDFGGALQPIDGTDANASFHGAEDEALRGYVREEPGRPGDGVDGYVPDPPSTRANTIARALPDAWKPFW